MDELDDWAAIASRGDPAWSEDAILRLEARLANEPSPAVSALRRQSRAMIACIGTAALCGFLTTGVMEVVSGQRHTARWPAAAMDASPSVLLIADRGR